MTIRNIFLDDGGVINDNSRRPAQWRRLVGEFFAPRLGPGGDPAAWAEANRSTLDPVFVRFLERMAAWDDASSDLRREIDLYDLDWLDSMAAEVGVETSPDETARLALVKEANAFIIRRVRADYPGAVDAIRALAADFTLFMSSGMASRDLDLTLDRLGVAELFARLYGPNLINTLKMHPAFYARLFADAAVDPAACLVLDDHAEPLHAARAAGAQVVLVGAGPTPPDVPIIAALAELPVFLAESPLLE